MSLRHRYAEGGYTSTGNKIPDIPVVRLMLLRRDTGTRATGPAIVDTGFDGGVLPNVELLTFFEGLIPRYTDKLAGPFGGVVDCEVFEVDGKLISEDRSRERVLGKVKVYIPLVPEYLADEVLLGREIANKFAMKLDGKSVDIAKLD